MGKSLFQKVWDAHSVRTLPSGQTQLFVGLHLIHEVTSPQAFDMMRQSGLEVAYPGPEFATAYGHLFADLERSGQRLAAMDHLVATSALVDGAALATGDSDDFSRVPRLVILSY